MLVANRQSDRLGKWSGQWFSRFCGTGRVELNMFERDQLQVTSHLEELATVQHWFRALISRLAVKTPWLNDQFDQLNLALAEGFTNAVRHAHADLPPATPIEIELVLQPEKIEICIFDRGKPFDPDSLTEPQPGALREGGYGWFLLRRLADQVTYDRTPWTTESGCTNKTLSGDLADTAASRNCLRIVKTLGKKASKVETAKIM